MIPREIKNIVVWSFKSAWILVKGVIFLIRPVRRIVTSAIGGWILVTRDSFQCPGCGGPISLVGRWECICGYVYDGFFFIRCPVCKTVPPYVKCQACGVGVQNPSLW
jgi:hypothetical protein